MRRLLVFNPTARRASRGRDLLEEMASADDTELRETSGPGDAAELARAARDGGVSRIVVAGGDGTVQEVVNGLAPFGSEDPPGGRRGEAGTPRPTSLPAIGLLPLGTGNDMARSLGVPLELEEAREVLEEGDERTVDLGRVSAPRERYFVNSAIGGVGGLVQRRLSDRLKRWLGASSYPIAALLALGRVPLRRVTVEWGLGRESLRADAYSVIIANGRFAGGGVPVAPEARTDDGLLDLVVIEARGGVGRIPGLAWSVLRGRHLERPDISHVRTDSFTLRSRPPMWVSLDGEVYGDEALEAEVVPSAVRMLVPSPGEHGGAKA